MNWLFRSFATYLLESGVDRRCIQEVLGYESSKTTEIYKHLRIKEIRQIRNLLDDSRV